MTVLTLILALGVWAATVARWRQPGQTLRKPAFDEHGMPTDANNLRSLSLLAVVATVYVIPVARFIDEATGLAGLAAAIMFVFVILGANELLMALRIIAVDPQQARRGRLLRGITTTVAIVALLTSIVIGHPADSDVSKYWGDANVLWMVVFWTAILSYFLVVGVTGSRMSLSYAKTLGPTHLRTSIRWLAVATGAAAFYALLKAITIAGVIGWLPPLPGALWWIAITVSVMTLSGVLASSWLSIHRSLERRRDRRILNDLSPLWRRLSVVDPTLPYDQLPTDVDELTLDELRSALYNSCIACGDWIRQLGWRLPDDAYQRAWRSLANLTEPTRTSTATAGWITAALNSPPASPTENLGLPPIGTDYDQLVHALRDVAVVQQQTADQVAQSIGMGERQ